VKGHEVMWKWMLKPIYSTFLTWWFLPYCTCCVVGFLVYFDGRCKSAICTVVRLIMFLVVAVLCMWLSFVYCDHFMCMCGLLMCMCGLLKFIDCIDVLLQMPDCWLEVSIRKVLWPTTSVQVFLGFPVSKSKCWDGSRDSKLPLHASHVALPK
jgi:hypothetical protein